ncbi:MAG TPA: hypothetical protein VMY42_14725 [Thermoguttaceae bacterium]|nr:hypothetical protein [Thermoguttaceae bacterium]
MLNQFEFAEAYATLDLRDREFRTKMGGIHQSLISMQGALDAAARKAQMFLLVGTGAIIGIMKVASDVEESMSKFNAVFKDGSGAAMQWAEELATRVKRSQYDIAGYMAQFQGTFVPLGYAREEAAQLSRVLTQLAIDAASFYNIQEPETVNLITSALVGNHEAVRRLNVVITETTLKQELMNMGIAKGVQGATEMQKVQARLNLILKGTTDAQGDAERTADSLANQFRAMMADVKDLAVEFGNELMPVVQSVIAEVRKLLQGWKELSPETKKAIVDWGLFSLKAAAAIVVVSKLTGAVLALVRGMQLLATASKAAMATEALGGLAAGGGAAARVFRGAAPAGTAIAAGRAAALPGVGARLLPLVAKAVPLGAAALAGGATAAFIGETAVGAEKKALASRAEEIEKRNEARREASLAQAEQGWNRLGAAWKEQIDAIAYTKEQGLRATTGGDLGYARLKLEQLTIGQSAREAGLKRQQEYAKGMGLGETPGVKIMQDQLNAFTAAVTALGEAIGVAEEKAKEAAELEATRIEDLNAFRQTITSQQERSIERINDMEREARAALGKAGAGGGLSATGYLFGAAFKDAIGSQLTSQLQQQLEVQKDSVEVLKSIDKKLDETQAIWN